jgi:hypothetical protein
MDTDTLEQMMALHKANFAQRQRKYKIVSALSYVVCGIFITGMIYIISIPYYGSISPIVAIACLIGAISSYIHGLTTTQEALSEAYGMSMFDTIKTEDMENM